MWFMGGKKKGARALDVWVIYYYSTPPSYGECYRYHHRQYQERIDRTVRQGCRLPSPPTFLPMLRDAEGGALIHNTQGTGPGPSESCTRRMDGDERGGGGNR
jgi:hypothetical protein